mgnify:CR=1 FL=1
MINQPMSGLQELCVMGAEENHGQIRSQRYSSVYCRRIAAALSVSDVADMQLLTRYHKRFMMNYGRYADSRISIANRA